MAKNEIPVVERQTTVKVPSSVPDYQGAGERLAKSDTLISDLGAHIAQVSSNEMAKQLGYQMGQNPHGDIGPSFTEFDKILADSYHAQANNTLSLEANKLFQDSQIEMSKAVRLTPELIESNNKQIQAGIANLVNLAPNAIKGRLNESLGAQLIADNGKYQHRMYTEQREDTDHQYRASVDLYTKQAYELAFSGDHDAAEDTVKTAQLVFQNALDNKYFKSEEAESFYQSVRQAKINGIAASSSAAAVRNGQYPEFAKRWAEQRPDEIGGIKITQKEYESATNAIISQASFIQNLQSQQQNIDALHFKEKMYENINAIAPSDIMALRSQVSPLQYEELQLEYIKQKKIFNNERAARNNIISGFSDPTIFSRGTEKDKNEAFYTQVEDTLKSNKIANGQIVQYEDEFCSSITSRWSSSCLYKIT